MTAFRWFALAALTAVLSGEVAAAGGPGSEDVQAGSNAVTQQMSIDSLLAPAAKQSTKLADALSGTANCSHTDLASMKACVRAIQGLVQSDTKTRSAVQQTLEMSCTGGLAATCKDTSIREACGTVACNTNLQSSVANCLKEASDVSQQSCGFYKD